MSSLAKIGIGLPRDVRVLYRNGFYGDAGAADKGVKLSAARVLGLHIYHDGCFNQGCRRHAA